MLAPTWLLLLAIVGGVVLLAVLLYSSLALLAPVAAPAPPSFADAARAVSPPRGWLARLDRSFEQMLDNTLLKLTPWSGVAWILLGGAVAAALAFALSEDLFVAALYIPVGMAVPLAVFLALQERKREAIQEQLPDGCFQLARCLRAGLALPDALTQTAEYTPPPLAELFRKSGTTMRLGLPPVVALRRAAEHAEVTDFDLLANTAALHAEAGGDFPAMLDRLAASIRDRNQFRGYFRAVTALGRATTYFVALAAPAAVVLYLLFQPALFAQLFRSSLGVGLLILAIVLEIFGVIWSLWLLQRRADY
jgi:tight adherence protein B